MNEVLDLLAPQPGEVAVDCTLGRGGHALEIGRRLGSTGTLLGFDVDPANLAFAANRLADLPCRVITRQANFAELPAVLDELSLQPDVVLADLGVSTNQLFDPAYGLGFARDAPLDMRLDPTLRHSAAHLIATMGEKPLADLLFQNAQERFSRRIARKIIETRRRTPITSTGQLADLVRSVVPRPKPKYGPRGRVSSIDPATRTFLALRMAVNREHANTTALLTASIERTRPGGRIGVISFQSEEDRLVKNAFRDAAKAGMVELLTKKPLEPTDAEAAANPRARSSKLRVARRC